ncbi:MAG: hypothetical protein DYG89_29460 [Caldilinea sp. CFX5]|nr:hypothetical protein [Caldilinea sp. CFX5]
MVGESVVNKLTNQLITLTNELTFLMMGRAMLQADFPGLVAHALKLYRDGDTLALATTALADSALVEAEFLAGDTITPAARGRAVQAVLTWAIQELRPHGLEPGPSAAGHPGAMPPVWRFYKILAHFYLDHWTLERIAAELNFSPTSIVNLRTKAIAALAGVLQTALASSALLTARRQEVINLRYGALQSIEQAIVRIAVFFQQPIPVRLLTEIAPDATTTVVQEALAVIVQQSLLAYDAQAGMVYAPPLVRDTLLGQLPIDERLRWHQSAAGYYETQCNYWEAAHHWRLAGASERAAQLLLEHVQTIINRLKGNELDDLLAAFQPTEVAAPTWVRLKLVSGQIAEGRANLAAALAAYSAALQTEDVAIKANAHYRLAKILEYRNLDEALAHYARGIELLERSGVDNPLLVKMYIHRSWIFIQDRQDFRRAESSLQRAKALIDPTNREDYADLYNASGELFHREGKWAYAIEDRLQAWLAAKESNDLERIVKIGYNVGGDYTEMHNFPAALTYLNQSLALAQEKGMLAMVAQCDEVIGICYFYQADYAAAIRSYKAAYQIFAQVQNKTALTNSCFNLAEAYAIGNDRAQARRYYEEGVALATTLIRQPDDADSLLIVKRFAELKQQYPLLLIDATTVNERQQRALAYVQQHGKITNREYRLLNGVQNKTAAAELKLLVAQQLLTQSGQGAAVSYHPPQPAAATSAPATVAPPVALSARQRQAIAYVQQHGQISNRIYRELTGVANKAAATDLRDLVEKGLFTQGGKGPATIYRLSH